MRGLNYIICHILGISQGSSNASSLSTGRDVGLSQSLEPVVKSRHGAWWWWVDGWVGGAGSVTTDREIIHNHIVYNVCVNNCLIY